MGSRRVTPGARGARLSGYSRQRRPGASVAVALSAIALLAAGCGVETHVNDPRPQPPTRVSVAINEDKVLVQPRRIAIGPEQTQQLPQNQNVRQPPVRSKKPLNVVLVATNLTGRDSRLQLRGRGRSISSGPLYRNANVTMQAILPTGVYTVSAENLPGAEPARLVIGPYRSSSENDVLLP